jgi:hypothetical protein
MYEINRFISHYCINGVDIVTWRQQVFLLLCGDAAIINMTDIILFYITDVIFLKLPY